VLRRSTDGDERMEFAPFPDLGPSIHGYVRQQTGPFAERHMLSHHAERSYDDVVRQLRLRVDNGMGMNLHAIPPVIGDQ
jgi:hypothetical protein